MAGRTFKILGISGSPRHANTDILVREALKGAESIGDVRTEFIACADLKIKGGCISCYACMKKPDWEKLCRGHKDDCNDVFRKMMKADGYLIGAPVYYGGVTGQLKCIMDRSMAVEAVGFPFRNRVAGVLTIAYDRQGGVEGTIHDIQRWLMIHDCIIVSIGPERPPMGSGCYFGAAAVQGAPQPIFYPTEGEEKAVLQDKVGMDAAKLIGKRVAEVTKLIQTGFDHLSEKELEWPRAAISPDMISFVPKQ